MLALGCGGGGGANETACWYLLRWSNVDLWRVASRHRTIVENFAGSSYGGGRPGFRKRMARSQKEECLTKRAKTKQPDWEKLDAWASAFLERAEALQAATNRLEEIAKETLQPRNDPEYLAALQARDKTREAIANKIDMLHLVPDLDKTWISAAFSHADGEEVARLMQEHFEAKLHRHAGRSE